MATLMEKDIVLEAVSGVSALISKKVEQPDPYSFNDDEKELHKLRFQLSRLSHEKIDFQAIVSRCKELRAKYEPMPFNALYASF